MDLESYLVEGRWISYIVDVGDSVGRKRIELFIEYCHHQQSVKGSNTERCEYHLRRTLNRVDIPFPQLEELVKPRGHWFNFV